MSWWNDKEGKVERFAPLPYPGYPGWEYIDCGCCNGIRWGGEEPKECNRCGGSGFIARHIKSGLLKDYPGGHFV